MLRPRVIPCLLLQGGGLVKTVRFRKPTYIGDPINAIRIFNERMVDELILLDITATLESREPPLSTIEAVASECFMPLTYGGGVTRLAKIERILSLGVEKVAINSKLVEDPEFMRQAATEFGSQSVIASLDVRRRAWGQRVVTHGGRRAHRADPVEMARRHEEVGAGELLLTDADRDGTMSGYNLDLIERVTEALGIPTMAAGGAGSLEDLKAAVDAGAAAAVAGSLFVYHGRHRGVLINYPTQQELEPLLRQESRAS